MRILFLTDNFPPEVNAPATRTLEHCREWVKQGVQVTVITGQPNFPQGVIYPGYRNRFFQKEVIEGIIVWRVWTYMSANKGFAKRIFDYLSYAIMAFVVGLFARTDLIVATSPQFFTALAGRCLAWVRRKPWVMEVRDMWPESIKTVGAMKGTEVSYRMLERLEMSLYRSATQIVPVTDAFKRQMVERGIASEKIKVVKNGVIGDNFRPVPKDQTLMRELGIEGKRVIGYIGTFGLAHALTFILQAANLLKDTDYHFLLIGGGAMKQKLQELAIDLELTNVTILPFQPKAEIGRYISLLDIALVNLKKSRTFESVIPSKIFENAAMNKPILLGVLGESKEMVEAYNAGVCFEPEDMEDFLAKLHELTSDPSLYTRCQAGCRELAHDFDRRHLANIMLQHLAHLVPAAGYTASTSVLRTVRKEDLV